MTHGKRDTKRGRVVACAALVLAAGTAGAQDSAVSANTLDLGTTSITGTQELPKVLYIVPWKTSDLGEIVGQPVNTLLDEALAPIDPEVFERQLDYRAMLETLPPPAAGGAESRDANKQED